MSIERPRQREADPMSGYESAAASFKRNLRTLDEFLDARAGTLSPEEQAAIAALQENMRKPFEPYAQPL